MLNENEYHELCTKTLQALRDKMVGRKLWIFGTGKGAQILTGVLQNAKIQISGYIDTKKQGIDDVNGCPVVSNFKELNPLVDFVYVSAMSCELGFEMIVECVKHGLNYQDIFFEVKNNSREFEDFVYRGVKIGRFTYGYEAVLSGCLEHMIIGSIGRFCSINGTARIWMNHCMETISSYPFMSAPFDALREIINYGESASYQFTDTIRIGNDVWIGANVIILPGVKIGDGAVIAAGAVVSKDVEPYEIVGGVPARHIKYRFSEHIRTELLKIRWWDWDIETIQKRQQYFYDIEDFVRRFDAS